MKVGKLRNSTPPSTLRGAGSNPEFATVMRVLGAMGIRLSAQAADAKRKKRAVA